MSDNPSKFSKTHIFTINDKEAYLHRFQSNCFDKVSNFQAGSVKLHAETWKTISNDKEIIGGILGYKIPFLDTPRQYKIPNNPKFSVQEDEAIKNEICNLLISGVIMRCDKEKDDFISPIFVRPKKDGSYRLILNLTELNKYVEYHHFKMDTLHTATFMIQKDSYMASIDLSKAYYSVSIAKQHRKYLKFQFKGALYAFCVLPNGLSSAPRLFTKILKTAFSSLRKKGHESASFIDDSFLHSKTYEQCLDNIISTIQLLTSLGFVIHPEKSVLIPTQEITLLGFVLNSVTMTVKLTPERIQKLLDSCKVLLSHNQPTIREVACVIGQMIAALPGVEFGALYYRAIERDKIHTLAMNRGNYESKMKLSEKAKTDIQWWISNVSQESCLISHGPPTVTIYTDSSMKGWGAHFTNEDKQANGLWSDSERLLHINILEIKACFMGLLSFCNDMINVHVRVMMDSKTAIAYISSFGGTHSNRCNEEARNIWLWAIDRNIWLSTGFVRSADNKTADGLSRTFQTDLEYKLDPYVFQQLQAKLNFVPNIDLFASRLNHQLMPYVSYKPDPSAMCINAFTMNWWQHQFYAFPPFSILPKVLQKIREDEATGIVIVPVWPTQSFFPSVLNLLIQDPIFICRNDKLLQLPGTTQPHRLHKKLNLLACLLSGDSSLSQAYQKKLKTLSCQLGAPVQVNSTKVPSKNGYSFAVNGIPIPLRFL